MKKLSIEELFLYLFSFNFFIPHFLIVSSGAPFTTFAPKAYSISLVIFIFSIIFFLYYYKKNYLIYTNLTKLVLLYLLIYFLSTIFSEDFKNSFFGWQYRNKSFLIITTITFLSIISPMILNDLKKINKLISIGIIFSSIYSIYGILQFFHIDPFYYVSKSGERVFSFFLNPNYFAPIILIFIYFSLNKILFENKYFYIIALILNISTVIASQTFTSFISLIISFIIYIILFNKFFKENKPKFIKFISIIISISIFFSLSSFFILNKYNPKLLKRYINLTTLKTRIVLWRDLNNMIKYEFRIKEYLIGIGGENLNRKFMPYKSPQLEKYEPNTTYDNSHNEYIEKFINGGISLTLSYFIILIYSFYVLIKSFKKNNNYKEISFSIFISMLTYLINLLGTYETIQMFVFFCFVLSLVNSLISLEYQRKKIKMFYNVKIIFLLFILLTNINFIFHVFLKISIDFANKGYNSLEFYKYIKDINKEFVIDRKLEILNISEFYFLQASKYNPFEKTYFSYYLAEIYYYKSLELNDNSYNEKSINILNEITNKSQFPNSVYKLIGDNYYHLKDIEKAKEYYNMSLEWYKYYNDSILSLAKIYLDENNLSDAERYIEIILSVKENAVAYRLKGIIYLKKDELEHAKKYLKRSVELGDKEAEKIIKSIDN